jgi:hypothetical protein
MLSDVEMNLVDVFDRSNIRNQDVVYIIVMSSCNKTQKRFMWGVLDTTLCDKV